MMAARTMSEERTDTSTPEQTRARTLRESEARVSPIYSAELSFRYPPPIPRCMAHGPTPCGERARR